MMDGREEGNKKGGKDRRMKGWTVGSDKEYLQILRYVVVHRAILNCHHNNKGDSAFPHARAHTQTQTLLSHPPYVLIGSAGAEQIVTAQKL